MMNRRDDSISKRIQVLGERVAGLRAANLYFYNRPVSELHGGARVLVDGHSAPVVGAVSMDCICVNLTGLETTVSAGDEVILVGGSAGAREVPGAEYVSPEEAAAAAGISAYELISRIGTRVCRVYRSGT